MKAIKIIRIAVTIAVLSIAAGCSDQFNSPTSGGEQAFQSEELLSLNSFNAEIRLKPNRSYIFDVSNTGLQKFSAIDVSIITDPNSDVIALDCQDLSIYGDSKEDSFIGCHSSGLNLKKITIENLSPNFQSLKVSLTGLRDIKSKK